MLNGFANYYRMTNKFALLPTRFPRLLILLLLVVLSAVGLVGYRYYMQQKQAIEQAARQQIKAIGDLKAEQIARWLEERKGDATALLHSPLAGFLRSFMVDSNAPKLRQEILEWLLSLIRHYGYQSTVLLDAHGKVIISVPPLIEPLQERTQDLVKEALRTRQVIFSDLYGKDKLRLDFIVPLLTDHGTEALAIGALLLRVDPNYFLFPLIQSWPTPSLTGETLLVRQEGDDIVYLNELRHRQDTALSLRLPINRPELPVAKAIRGELGEINGIDYRGVEVLAAVRQIPNSPWYLVAKVDRREINAPIRERAVMTMSIVILVMAVAGLVAWAVWRRQTEMVLHGAKAALEAKVRERTAQLERLNAELETRVEARTRELAEADRHKDQFLALLGHELRNPLNPIRNAVELLKLEPKRLDSSLHWTIDLIDRQVMHLTRMLDDLLDVSRIGQGKIMLQKAPVPLADVVVQAVETAKPLIEQHRHELTVSLPQQPIYLEADPTRLAQVIVNLLHNAAKYTDESGHIQLKIQQDNDHAVITVRDDGIGISSELLPRIFEPFAQDVHLQERAEGGLGLGLMLVRKLIEMHGGSIRCYSAGPRQGSEFIIRLPVLMTQPQVYAKTAINWK